MKAVALAVVAVLGAVPAAAAPSGNGKIAFATERAIRVVNADGSGLSTLAAGRIFSGPVWSPEGAHIAFGTAVDGAAEAIVVVKADGSERRTVATRGAVGPVWSPDGTRIAFRRFANLYVVRADGVGETLLTAAGSLFSPTWSPDGTRLAFTRGEKLFVIDSDGSNPRAIDVPRAAAVAWSPDGSRIAFLTDERLPYLNFCCAGAVHVVNPDGTGLTKVTQTLNYASGLQWSPDGSGLLVASADFELHAGIPYPRGGQFGVYAPDGGRFLAGQIGSAPSWSPDGTRVVFMRWHERLAGVGSVYVGNADGTCATRLLTDSDIPRSPAWQPAAGVPSQPYARCTDLIISRMSPAETDAAPPTVHDPIQIGFRLTNGGNRTATGVSVRLDLPSGLKRPRASVGGRSCVLSAGRARCSLRTLGERKSVVLAVGGTPTRAGRYAFVASGSSAEVDVERSNNRVVHAAHALDCTVTGSRRGDTLIGTARRDRICGLDGADTLRGLARADQLVGHRGPDVLDGGAGPDTLWGGSGADRLRAADGSIDVVICGAGADRVRADRADLVARDCERVVRR